MNPWLKSKPVVLCVVAVALLFTTMVFRVVSRRHARTSANASAAPANKPSGGPLAAPSTAKSDAWRGVAENAAYLDQYYDLDRHSRDDQDAQGVPLTRRKTPGTPTDFGRTLPIAPALDPTPPAPAVVTLRSSSRLQGRISASGSNAVGTKDTGATVDPSRNTLPPSHAASRLTRGGGLPLEATGLAATGRVRPQRFNPYGGVLKCELVFPLDSVNEQMPLVGLVMEPVYNNGALVIPAGTEVHGTARPDRLRNRLFSGEQWVLVFPRDAARVNGRQLNVRGVALERAEPDVNGMTWRMTDGSYGLEGTLIRSMNGEEIKRFVATFLAAGSAGLQSKQGNAVGGDILQSTPRNAVLQGLSADMQQVAADVAAEIAQHGVYIHIPAGHQFYLYPTQLIDPDAADISSDIATVK